MALSAEITLCSPAKAIAHGVQRHAGAREFIVPYTVYGPLTLEIKAFFH